jgi:hypothetical protein
MVDRFSIRKPSSQIPAESAILRARGDFDLRECFIDGTFVAAKKWDSERERPSWAFEMIARHRGGGKKPATQAGPSLGRYSRRHTVE